MDIQQVNSKCISSVDTTYVNMLVALRGKRTVFFEALALEREHWENLYVSPLEIHEHLARDVLYGKRAACPKSRDVPKLRRCLPKNLQTCIPQCMSVPESFES